MELDAPSIPDALYVVARPRSVLFERVDLVADLEGDDVPHHRVVICGGLRDSGKTVPG